MQKAQTRLFCGRESSKHLIYFPRICCISLFCSKMAIWCSKHRFSSSYPPGLLATSVLSHHQFISTVKLTILCSLLFSQYFQNWFVLIPFHATVGFLYLALFHKWFEWSEKRTNHRPILGNFEYGCLVLKLACQLSQISHCSHSSFLSWSPSWLNI